MDQQCTHLYETDIPRLIARAIANGAGEMASHGALGIDTQKQISSHMIDYFIVRKFISNFKCINVNNDIIAAYPQPN